MLTSIVGTNWGDEGKGRMVDLLSKNYDIVVRYQGGNNAGHTVINEYGKFALNLLPSGVFHEKAVNLLGTGTVIDLKHLCGEIGRVREKGVPITRDSLKISDRAVMVLPIHPLQDKWEEARLGKDHFGSTLRGISPVYGDKYMKKALRMGDLLHPEHLKKELKRLSGHMRCEVHPCVLSMDWTIGRESIELKTELSCSMMVFSKETFDVISGMEVDIENPLDVLRPAPLVVYYGEKGERLVDIEALAPLCVAFSDDGRGVQDKGLMREAMYRAAAVGKVIAALFSGMAR